MKQIKVTPVVYEMLQEISRRRRIKMDNLIEEMVMRVYSSNAIG